MRVYLCRCLFLRKQVRILYFPHEKQRKGSADKPDSRRCSFPQEMEETGALWVLSGAPESNNFASADATGAAKKQVCFQHHLRHKSRNIRAHWKGAFR